jgi:hypothetical protein
VHSRLELEKETLVCQCHQSSIFFNYGERMLNKSNGGKKKKKKKLKKPIAFMKAPNASVKPATNIIQ